MRKCIKLNRTYIYIGLYISLQIEFEEAMVGFFFLFNFFFNMTKVNDNFT